MKGFKPSFDHKDKDYLVFLGRLSPEKGPHLAIQVAKMLGAKLILAGKIDRVDRSFYKQHVEPLVDGSQVQYIGEVDHYQKAELLRHAKATLCPVLWPEPFGLVMIESMACGTPVFALRDGSVPEVIDHGKTGYVANSIEELAEALRDWKAYDRHQVRQIAEHRFSAERMTDDHVQLYSQLMHAQAPPMHELAQNPLTPTRVAEIKHSAHTIKGKPSHTFEFTLLENERSSDWPKQSYRKF
jgi:glycosyltransferase involved in cell wall biosynthesis